MQSMFWDKLKVLGIALLATVVTAGISGLTLRVLAVQEQPKQTGNPRQATGHEGQPAARQANPKKAPRDEEQMAAEKPKGKKKGPEKVTVADVLRGLSLDPSKLRYIDEPPGKLQELECETTLRDTKVRVRVRIEVVYTLALFSDQRKWAPQAVRAATVRKVTITAGE
jgi:hypothetical protein